MNREERHVELDMWLSEAKGAERVAVLQAIEMNEINGHLDVIAGSITNIEARLFQLNENLWRGMQSK